MKRDGEAAAIERVADAARQVQAASKALEGHFNESIDGAAPTLPLARLTAAINELQSARDALDALLAPKQTNELTLRSPSQNPMRVGKAERATFAT